MFTVAQRHSNRNMPITGTMWYIMVSRSTLKKYNVTQKEFDEQLVLQRNSCALCHRPFNESGKKRRIVIDHCHSCKKVRGLVCYWCNRFFICKNTYRSSVSVTNYLFRNKEVCETPITRNMWSVMTFHWNTERSDKLGRAVTHWFKRHPKVTIFFMKRIALLSMWMIIWTSKHDNSSRIKLTKRLK